MPRTPTLSPNAIPIAREIFRRMVEQGFTQRTLANAAGVNETYCRDLFRGRSQNPKTDQLRLVARALNCTVEDLESPGGKHSADQVLDFTGVLPLSPSEIPLLKLWRLLDHAPRNRILSEMAGMIEPPRRRKSDNI